jgi:hypothetical protein
VANEHLYWDQAMVFDQLGVLDLPLAGLDIWNEARRRW